MKLLGCHLFPVLTKNEPRVSKVASQSKLIVKLRLKNDVMQVFGVKEVRVRFLVLWEVLTRSIGLIAGPYLLLFDLLFCL
jgi:hypothetical protein